MPFDVTTNPRRPPRLAGTLAPMRLSNGYTPMLGSARIARQWIRRRRQLRVLNEVYPAVTTSLALDPGWRVHRLLSTVGDVTVALVGDSAPAAVLKCARGVHGTAALDHSGAVVTTLSCDPRLTGWAHLLPRRLRTTRTPHGDLVVLEELLAGAEGRTAITPATWEEVLASVLTSIGDLHKCTAYETAIDRPLLNRWVEEPITVLSRWYHATGPSSRTPTLERLREELYRGLEGREVRVGWIHGDLSPGNVLLEPGTHEVSGLLDWERASPIGLPEIDEIHMRLSIQMHVQNRELGDLVCDFVGGRRDQLFLRGDVDPSLVLLTWLHHVSGVLAKSDRHSTRGFWAARNVHMVLTCVEMTSSPLTDPGPFSRPGR